MTKEMKQELFKYCERNYKRAVEDLRYHKKNLFGGAYRPKNAKGEDLIEMSEKRVSHYHSGMVELTDFKSEEV